MDLLLLIVFYHVTVLGCPSPCRLSYNATILRNVIKKHSCSITLRTTCLHWSMVKWRQGTNWS